MPARRVKESEHFGREQATAAAGTPAMFDEPLELT